MDSSADAPQARNRHFAGSILLTLLVGIIIFAAIIFLSVGRWLIAEDPLDKADAIVILSGRMPVRAKEAARLYNTGSPAQVWPTPTNHPPPSLNPPPITSTPSHFFT